MVTHVEQRQRSVRTILVSDIHLGCRFAQPEHFLSFLEQVTADKVYILGDFLDGWKLSATWTWKPVYTRILNRLLTMARNGTELFYTPGNHDAFLRCQEIQQIVASTGVNVQVEDEFVFEAHNGQRYLVTHGDKFDMVEMRYQWLSFATAFIYEPLLYFNWMLSAVTRQQKKSPYAMCAFIKDKVKGAVKFISSFETQLYDHARSRDCDGIICGHIHRPGREECDSVTYLNTGDWVENCTALVEHHDGSIHLESFFPGVPSREVAAKAISNEWDSPVTIGLEDSGEVPGLAQPAGNVACVG